MGPYASTADQFLVKAFNQGIVLHLLRVQGPLSRADIAKLTGLNKTTVSVLVDELIRRHLVREVGMGTSSGGRRPRLLSLNAQAGLVVGADLAVDYLLVVVLDLQAKTVWKRRVERKAGSDPAADLNRLGDLIAEGVAAVPPTPLGLLGIGVGVHGPVEYPGGRLLIAPNMGWSDVPVGEILRERFHVPIVVDNEANAGAVAELWAGAGQDVRDLFYFSIGMGVGTGIVLNGDLYRGSAGTAGEFGHTTIDPSGPPCTCGNRGCLETFVSERALMRYVQQSGREPVPTAAEIFAAADRGEAWAIAALAQVGNYLGIGVANVINTFNPELVIIGGPMGAAGHHVLNAVRRVAEQRALPFPFAKARIITSSLGEEACALGAGILILQEFFRIPQVRTKGDRVPDSVLNSGGRRPGAGALDPIESGAHYSTVGTP